MVVAFSDELVRNDEDAPSEEKEWNSSDDGERRSEAADDERLGNRDREIEPPLRPRDEDGKTTAEKEAVRGTSFRVLSVGSIFASLAPWVVSALLLGGARPTDTVCGPSFGCFVVFLLFPFCFSRVGVRCIRVACGGVGEADTVRREREVSDVHGVLRCHAWWRLARPAFAFLRDPKAGTGQVDWRGWRVVYKDHTQCDHGSPVAVADAGPYNAWASPNDEEEVCHSLAKDVVQPPSPSGGQEEYAFQYGTSCRRR